MSYTRKVLAILLTLFVTISSGCAVMSRENRPVLEGLDAVVKKSGLADSTTSRIAFAPLAVTAGLTAVTIDMVVITPTLATVPAMDDTSTWLWKDPQGSEMRQAMLFMPKVAATPIVFVTDWAFRSLFATRF